LPLGNSLAVIRVHFLVGGPQRGTWLETWSGEEFVGRRIVRGFIVLIVLEDGGIIKPIHNGIIGVRCTEFV
jgi:hypothetical protein